MKQQKATLKHSKKSLLESDNLWNSQLFKSPKIFAKAYYGLIYKTFRDTISQGFMCTYSKKVKDGKFINSRIHHRYLIFKDGTDLDRIRKMVHQIFPTNEVIEDCPNQDCTCKLQMKVAKTKRIRKRRGFGYITESQIKECVEAVQLSGRTCRFEKYYLRKGKGNSHVSSPVKCDRCDFVAKSSLGIRSHIKARHNAIERSKISKVCS